MVAWTKDGTRYSYQYRTFVSHQKRYYIYSYTENLTLTMEQSVMVLGPKTTEQLQNKLVLIPLPFDTKYQVSINNLTMEAIINKNTYLDESYYCFLYPQSLVKKTDVEKIFAVKTWYQNYCQGETVNDEFIITYAGAKFKVDFDQKKVNPANNKEEIAFQLIYLGAS